MTAARAFAALAAAVVLFQVAVAAGAPLGHLSMGGRWPGRLPAAGRVAALVSAVLNAAMAAVIFGLEAGHPLAPVWAGWTVAAVLALGVVLHILTPSRAERRLWLPVILGQIGCALAVLWPA